MMVIVFILATATGAFIWAGMQAYHGVYVADRLCTLGPALCDHPGILLAATLVAVVFAIARQFLRSA